jgi:beta-lactamase class A
LGLKNTFMAAPFDEVLPVAPHIVTEANSRPGLTTQPDPYLQTTARDMGLTLEMLVECSQGGGALLAAYAGQIKPDECQQALSYMALNDTHELITQAIPAGTRMLHRQGYGEDTHADNAAIWGPAGSYVLSVYLQQSPKLDYYLSSQTMEDLSTAVWNYYTVLAEAQPKTP